MGTRVYQSAPTAGPVKRALEKTIEKEGGPVPYWVSSMAGETPYKDPDFPIAMLDVVMHVSFWIVALIYEVLVWVEADHLKAAAVPDTRTFPFALASLITFVVPLSIVIISTIVHQCKGCNMGFAGTEFPFITAIIEGALVASILFTLICVLYTIDVAGATDAWREYAITLIVVKCMAASFMNANVKRALIRRQ
jgi:hypothetical protein